jgi:hypothetical protein
MKSGLIIFAFLAMLSTAAFAQAGKPSPDPDAPAGPARNNKKANKSEGLPVSSSNSAVGQAEGTLSSGSGMIAAGTALQGQLQNTIDVRRSHVGDEVILKTVNTVKHNGETVIPKGSQLVGRITEITQRSNGSSESRIGMVFDRIQGQNLSQPISASIVSITNLASSSSVGDDLFSSDISGSSASSGRVSRGSSSSGGLLGGVTSTASSTLGGVTNTVGGLTNATTQTVGGTTRSLGSTVNGLRISGAASGSANSSSTISSGDKNLHIEKGATFGLRVNN